MSIFIIMPRESGASVGAALVAAMGAHKGRPYGEWIIRLRG